jgi:hypothetical protein
MNEKIMNAWEWVKDHKSEVAIAGCAAIIGGCGVVLYKNRQASLAIRKTIDAYKSHRPEKIEIIDLGLGKLEDAIKYPNGTVELWLDDIPLKDMGALGDAITAQIDGIPGDNNVWALLSVKPKVNE